MDGPFRDFPALIVYHPSSADGSLGHPFANLAFSGFSASVTGMSSKPLGISEIGVSYPDASFGKETYLAPGYPFTYLLRDILQFDNTVEEAVTRITGAKRTCDLILGVGDGNSNKFRGFQYSPTVANVFDDTNLEPTAEWHPKINDIVYWGMDWICPNDNTMLSHQLNAYHGNLTAELTIREVIPYVQTGDLHVAIYDFSSMHMFVSVARPGNASGAEKAFQRPFAKLNMTQIFAEPHP